MSASLFSFSRTQFCSLNPSSITEQIGLPNHISHFKLDNELRVVVIEDHRTPVVTHMIWYCNGSADDPPGKSGIAHFLEHLMFKGTSAHPKGEFSETIASLGGQENAFTSNDYTAYFQRVAKQHLAKVMEFEADRMTNLVLDDETVDPERDVVLEERRMRYDNDPSAQLQEAVQACLYTHHPYGTPVIGWRHEIESLNRHDALAYYQRFYTPENAILVVAGDVTSEEVRKLAQETYGIIPQKHTLLQRIRPQEPESHAHRQATIRDEKVDQPMLQRAYIVPSQLSGNSLQSEAIEVYAHLLGGGMTSILYRTLVVEEKIAVAAGAYYMSSAIDPTRFFIYGVPAEGISLSRLESALDELIGKTQNDAIEVQDLERCKQRMVADAIYAQDNQMSLARWFGSCLATGMNIEDIIAWPEKIAAVTANEVQLAARLLQKKTSVTGFLLSERSSDPLMEDHD